MMERPPRPHVHRTAAAADPEVTPKTLVAEIKRLLAERERARKALATAQRDSETAVQQRDDATRERDEYLAALQRERAEFLNFKRRTAEERQAMLGLAAEGLISKVLTLADDFDRAVDTRPDTIADDPWVEGIAAIDRKLRLLLESEGVSAIDAPPGTPFDPRVHEAVANVPNTGRPDGEVVDELRRGYKLRDRVIRPALVAVAQHDDDSDPESHPLTLDQPTNRPN
jgi:molecular chaperone GrpE